MNATSLALRILFQALGHPLKTCAVDDQTSWSYGRLVAGAMHLADRIDNGSAAQNIGLLLPTGGAFPMAALASWWLGRTVVPINYLLAESERQYIVEDAELDLVVTAGPMLDHLDGD
ncbi:MAG: AMP-binding protein, partial [Phycisphaeraceae bacterium]|nr:AMP-binding protein [Phycisphaeraceae bacterium]